MPECLRLHLWLGLVTLVGCASTPPSEYPVKDSRRPVSDSAGIYWVDDRRVLFVGFNGREAVRADGYKVLLQSVYLWDLASGAIEPQGETSAGLCFVNGYIRYRMWRDGQIGNEHGDFVAGPLGSQERETISVGRIDLTTCRPYREPQPLPDWTRGESIRRLKPEHGFLVLGPEKSERNTPVTYHPAGARDGILMPFKRREIYSDIRYSTFKGAYLVISDYFVQNPGHPHGGYNKSPWPKDLPQPLWWLYPDGRVEEIKIPYGPWKSSGSTIFSATRRGIFLISHNMSSLGNPGNAGGYLVHGADVRKLVTGYLNKPSVSPDGCKVGFIYDPWDTYARNERADRVTLEVIDLCQARD